MNRTHLALLALSGFSLAITPRSLNAQGFHWSYNTRISTSFGDHSYVPVPESVPDPLYPFEMVRAAISGTVSLTFRVSADGTVDEVHVVSSSPTSFSNSAVAAVKTWRFRPLATNGPEFPSTVVVNCRFKFEIDQGL